MSQPKLTTFRTPAAFRAWLTKSHARSPELIVRCYKVHAAGQGITYAQALHEALCVGWIDGIRRAVDADSFSVRFTPRRPRSTWSRVNIGHVERLMAAGRMAKPGLDVFARRESAPTGVDSFENRPGLAPALAKSFRANKAAWTYYQQQAPWYRRTSAHWVMSAKRDQTRAARLALLIGCSARGEPIPQLDRRPGPGDSRPDPRVVAFLRAINVGGHTVTMARLRALFESMGCTRVETFIASGNVLFDAPARQAGTLERRLERGLREALGYEVAAFVRTGREVAAIARYEPFPPALLARAVALSVGFLHAPLSAAAQRALGDLETGIDMFHIHGREVYWLSRRKQSESTISHAVFERTLGAPCTLRGINTVRRLAARIPGNQG